MFVDQVAPGLRSRNTGDDARQDYMRSILARHLLEIEARSRGLHEDDVIQTEFRRLWRQRLIEAYRRQILPGEVEISEEEIRTYFVESGLDRRREMAGILVDDEALAQRIRQELAAGADFGQLARAHSIDERSREQDGVLGFIDLLQASRLQVPNALFRDLPAGRVSEVLPMGRRFQLVRFGSEQPVPYKERRADIYELIYKRKFGELEKREVQRMESRLDLKMVPQGLALLLEKGDLYTRLRSEQLSEEEHQVALFAYKGGQITLGDYVEILSRDMRSLSGWGLNDEEEVREVASELVLTQVMLFEGAKRAGIADRPGQRAWAENTQRRLLIEELRRREVVEPLSVTRQEARNYYQDHEALFVESDEYVLVEVLVDTEEEARALRQQIDAGMTISALAQEYTQRADAKEEAGLMHMGDYERLAMPQLYKAVSEAEKERIVGPVQVRDGYSLFKVMDRRPGQLKPFDQVERKARALVRAEKKEVRFEDWIDQLMEEYGDRIAVSQEMLAQALPDTFLTRLAAAGNGSDK
jgi:parvulin-like peptidyl-prolyl isomerase